MKDEAADARFRLQHGGCLLSASPRHCWYDVIAREVDDDAGHELWVCDAMTGVSGCSSELNGAMDP